MDFIDGANATRGSGTLPKESPISAECFLPPRLSCPRAWQRVPVAPVPGLRRQPKIWKRVGSVLAAPGEDLYTRAMAELEQQSQLPRKRARHVSYIPAWGDARWDLKLEEEHDGKQDLDEARAVISTAEQEAHAAILATNRTKTKPPTFPEEKLKWVPRKRHNSRWPIQPKEEEATRMVADLQPLIEFEVPASPEPVDVTLKMDEKQMRRRSTRRLSRRFTLIPGEGSPRKLPMITLSPAEHATPVLSPVKRLPVTLSPAKVADSPHRSFRINATPTKVVLESPQINPPAMSPAKPSSSPITPIEDGMHSPAVQAAEPTSTDNIPASPVPLLFDQPIPDVHTEPEHEVRRRRSLQSARRCERGSSGASRLLALKSGRSSPNRRHSFTSLENPPADAQAGPKGRRNTMDAFCVGPDGMREVLADDKGIVEIDMKTSLDIFSQPTKATEPAPHPQSNGEQEDSEPNPAFGSTSPISPANDGLANSGRIFGSSVAGTFGVTEGTGVARLEYATLRQAATSLTADQTDMEHDCVVESPPHSSEEPVNRSEGEQSEMAFVPHDPEGLSTIYEESSLVECSSGGVVERSAPALTGDASFQSSSDEEHASGGLSSGAPCAPYSEVSAASVQQQDRSSTSAEPARSPSASAGPDVSIPEPAAEATQPEPNEQSLAGPMPEPDVSASHVAGTPDVMSSSDSPQRNDEASFTGLLQPTSLVKEDGHTSTLSGSEGSIAPPSADDVIYAPVSLGLKTEGSPAVSEEQDQEIFAEGAANDNRHLSVPASPVSRSQSVASKPPLPGTPTAIQATDLMQRVGTPEASVGAAAPQQESSGFTPINGYQISLPNVTASGLRDEEEAEADQESDELDADEVVEEELGADEDCEAAMAIDEDVTIEAPRPEFDTLQLHARHDDSETEMLRNFVTRVTADKNAKAAAAAAALAKKVARRSGSLGSTTSSTGSPMARAETPVSRTPLGVKSSNSPSPAKKRKLECIQDDLAKDKDSSQDANDGPRLKRRRKRTEAILETALENATPSPEPDSLLTPENAPGPRRSTRARSTRIALRPSAPSANSIAFSMIPVRLPGMGAMDDAAMDAHLANMARQRSEEKDLAAVTRANTRKNKGGAVPPQVVLAKQAEDPSWRMRELKGVFEAKERRAKEAPASDGDEAVVDAGKTGKAAAAAAAATKGVRWAEELVKFQTEAEPSVFRGMASQLLADVVMMDDGADEIAEAEPPTPAEPVVEKTARVAARKTGSTTAAAAASVSAPAAAPVSTRRTRSSRLPPPTPVKKIQKTAGEKAAAAEKTTATTAAPSLRTRAKSLPKLAPAPAPSPADDSAPVVAAAKSTSTKAGMATRRTRISKLGMSGNGTPAPKRRGRTAT